MYTGHFIVPTADWVTFARSHTGRVAICLASDYPVTDVIGGDPIFILTDEDGERSIHFHAGFSFLARASVSTAIANWGQQLGVRNEADLDRMFRGVPRFVPSSEVDVLGLLELIPVSPGIRLKSIGIEMPADAHYKECEPSAVLTVLRALPVAAETDWTRRVVGRNNDVPR